MPAGGNGSPAAPARQAPAQHQCHPAIEVDAVLEHQPAGPVGRRSVAIIGMSCLFPGAPDVDAYWRNILGKVDSITDPPPEAWPNPEEFLEPEEAP